MDHDLQAPECPPELLSEALEAMRTDDVDGLRRLDALIERYGLDARLHFLRGSLLAGLKRYGEAHAAMARAVEVAPGYALARFQLGFLELTSGDSAAADATWRPLQDIDPDNPLGHLVRGLQHLARDEFEPAIAALSAGMARNADNPALNADMQLIIDELKAKLGGQGDQSGQGGEAEPTSSAQLLLQQQAAKPTKH